MEYTFANGTEAQKALWREGPHHLLNLPFDKMPLVVAVEFKPTVSGQTAFASTTFTYGSTSASTLVRNDYPGFGTLDAGLVAEAAALGLEYNATMHAHETAVHELGHVVFAAIPHSFRVAIAQLFGAKSDTITELEKGTLWQNRIIEGIAETFKEAFLPSKYRVFPNRTNRKISYAVYPKFRRLIREGLEAIEGSGGEEIIPAYNLDTFKKGGSREGEKHSSSPKIDGNSGLWEPEYRQRYEGKYYPEGYERYTEVFHTKPKEERERFRGKGTPATLLAGNKDGRLINPDSTFDYWVLDGAEIQVEVNLPNSLAEDQVVEEIWGTASNPFGGAMSGYPYLPETIPGGGSGLWASPGVMFRAPKFYVRSVGVSFAMFISEPPAAISKYTNEFGRPYNNVIFGGKIGGPLQVIGWEWLKTPLDPFLLTHGFNYGGLEQETQDEFFPTRELYKWPANVEPGDARGLFNGGPGGFTASYINWLEQSSAANIDFIEGEYGQEYENGYGRGPVQPNTKDGDWYCFYDATSRHVKRTLPVNEELFPTTKVCNGRTYRRVKLKTEVFVWMNDGPLPEAVEGGSAGAVEMWRKYVEPWVPSLMLVQKRCSKGETEGGSPIAIPATEATPEGVRTGARLHGRPVSGTA